MFYESSDSSVTGGSRATQAPGAPAEQPTQPQPTSSSPRQRIYLPALPRVIVSYFPFFLPPHPNIYTCICIHVNRYIYTYTYTHKHTQECHAGAGSGLKLLVYEPLSYKCTWGVTLLVYEALKHFSMRNDHFRMRDESSFSQNRDTLYLKNKKKEKYPIFLRTHYLNDALSLR
jgi:hypothetical protein